nr:hypothetical protein [Tanacetum cinerariifolium]
MNENASTVKKLFKFKEEKKTKGPNLIAIVTTKKETLHECRKMEEAQGPTLEGRITFSRIQLPDSEGTTNMGWEESQGQTKEEREPKDTVQPLPNSPKKDIPTDEEIEGNDEHPERPNYRFIAKHELKTYPHIEPRVQRKRSIAPDKIKVVKEEVEEWLKAEIVRKGKSRESNGFNKHVVTKQFETNVTVKRITCYLNQIPFQSSKKGPNLPRHSQKVYKQKGLSLDNRGRRSIPRNEEIDSGTTNFNDSKEGRRTHGLSIGSQ